MSQPSPTYALSLSSESDLDSTILSPLVAESVLAFTSAPTRTERPLAQQFEDIDSLATESVNNESQMSTVLSTGIQEPAVVQHSTHYMHTNMVVFQVSIAASYFTAHSHGFTFLQGFQHSVSSSGLRFRSSVRTF